MLVTQGLASQICESTVVLCTLYIGMDEVRSWPIMPVHSEFPIYTFPYSHNPMTL